MHNKSGKFTACSFQCAPEISLKVQNFPPTQQFFLQNLQNFLLQTRNSNIKKRRWSLSIINLTMMTWCHEQINYSFLKDKMKLSSNSQFFPLQSFFFYVFSFAFLTLSHSLSTSTTSSQASLTRPLMKH